MAYQCRRRIYCDLFAWYWSAKRFVNRRYAFRSLWSPSFYHSGDRLLPDFFHWHSLCSDDFVAYACGFSGYGQQFFRCRYLSQFDGSLPSLPSTANILIKAFVSGGQFLLPIIISLLVWANMWFGWSFLLAGAIMLINALFYYAVLFHLSRSDIEAQNLASACHRRTSLLPHRSYQLHPLWLYLDGNLLSYQPVAGAVWTVRRRNVVYPIHQTVKYLYLRIATVRFITARWSEKQFALPHY